ncbi:DUF948 domain-containing protein [Sporosarcina sp. FSL W7-1349]|uniref:DUF948 domain-containing protein n=1 Tax=Sporosarcina sp. FSL W7-1349 TaxID=2921561 RepID=UPI0030FB9280
MGLTGVGVLLLGAGFLVLAIFIAKVLNHFSSILEGVNETVDRLPDQLDEVLAETSEMIRHSNDTLADVNEKLGTLTPLFHVAGDVGETTRKLSSSLVDVAEAAKSKVVDIDEEKRNKRLGGLYGTAALGLYAARKRKEAKSGGLKRPRNLMATGEEKAFDIARMKAEAKEAAREGKYIVQDQ